MDAPEIIMTGSPSINIHKHISTFVTILLFLFFCIIIFYPEITYKDLFIN